MAFIVREYDSDKPRANCTACERTSYIRRIMITIIECGAMLHNDICDLWNNTRCSNDDCYCNPFIEGDKIYLQFNLPIPMAKLTGWFNLFGPPTPKGTTAEWNTDYFAALVDENGEIITEFNEISSFTSAYGIAVDSKTGKPFVWMTIDTNKLNGLCDFNVTIADGDLADPNAVIANQFYTEPYCCVKCDTPTVLVRGTYNKYDQFGGYHGPFDIGSYTGDQNDYTAQIRVYGNIEKTSNTIEKTVTNNISVKTKISPVYLLRTNKIPEYVADLLTVALAGQSVFIDEVEFDSPSSVDKNNVEGSMWLVESTIPLLTDDIDFEC